jgi:hypothetical protein
MAEPPSDPWQVGHQAGQERRPLLSNPYPAGTSEHRAWQAGWRAAEGTARPGDETPPAGSP